MKKYKIIKFKFKNLMEKLNPEKLKNIVKLTSEDFLRIQKYFFKEIERYSEKIKLLEKSKNHIELQKDIEKLKKFIQEYNIKYLKNINEEQIKYTKKLIESFENKQNSIRSQISIEDKKKLIQKKMHEKYLERRNINSNENFDNISFSKISEKEISNKKIMENIIDSSSNLIKYYEKFKQNGKENQTSNKLFLNTNTNNNGNSNPYLTNFQNTDNRVIHNVNNNYPNNNNLMQNRISSINHNSDFNFMNRMPSMNFNNTNNNNFESYFILDYKHSNNNIVSNNNNNILSDNINSISQENLNIIKYIEDLKIIKNNCSDFVKYLRDDPNYLKNAENDISILKDEILKEYLKYTKLKKHLKNILSKNKNQM